MPQPFAVAQVFTGYEGKLVPLKDTIRSFKEIITGKHDTLPESAFYMVGTIEDVIKKDEQLAKDMGKWSSIYLRAYGGSAMSKSVFYDST